MVVAAAMFVAGPTLVDGYARDTDRRLGAMEEATAKRLADMDRQTKRLMRDLGFNLRIVHRDTDMTDVYANFTAGDMPEEYVHRLAKAEQLTKIVHLVATLQAKFKWRERTVWLVGVLPEVTQSHVGKKPPMGHRIEPGTVFLGHELGAGLSEGESIDVGGHPFTIAKILPEHGTREDIMLGLELHDAQRVLDKPGKVNQIMALGCKCESERLSEIRAQLEGVLPETKITEDVPRAVARAEQRDLVAKNQKELIAAERATREGMQRTLARSAAILTPLTVLFSAAFVGLLTWLNVRERRPEIGLLRAIGKGTTQIVSLLLGKAAVLGVVGGAAGAALGVLLALKVGGEMGVQPADLAVDTTVLLAALLGTPLVAAIAAYLPTLHAVTQDPAVVLIEQ